MTQAVNLANFANNLDSSGGMNPSALNAATPVSKGGTGSTTASGARTNLGVAIGSDVPAPNGTGSTGTWPISITGSATSITATDWTVEQSGSDLVFKYSGTVVAKITSAGVITSQP